MQTLAVIAGVIMILFVGYLWGRDAERERVRRQAIYDEQAAKARGEEKERLERQRLKDEVTRREQKAEQRLKAALEQSERQSKEAMALLRRFYPNYRIGDYDPNDELMVSLVQSVQRPIEEQSKAEKEYEEEVKEAYKLLN